MAETGREWKGLVQAKPPPPGVKASGLQTQWGLFPQAHPGCSRRYVAWPWTPFGAPHPQVCWTPTPTPSISGFTPASSSSRSPGDSVGCWLASVTGRSTRFLIFSVKGHILRTTFLPKCWQRAGPGSRFFFACFDGWAKDA